MNKTLEKTIKFYSVDELPKNILDDLTFIIKKYNRSKNNIFIW